MSDQAEVDKLIVANYGAKNLSKVKRNMRNGSVESKRRFVEKYPDADLDRFEYQVELDINGDIDKYVVYYKVDDVSSYDITSSAFLSSRVWSKHLNIWPAIWDIKGTQQEFTKNLTGIPHKVNSFRIYVTNDLFFDTQFSDLDISLGKDTYFNAIYAAYIATYSCGICTKHFEYNDNTPKIITSIARYHLYFTMRKFMRSPDKMNRYINSSMRYIVFKYKPPYYTPWSETLFHAGKTSVTSWITSHPKGSIRNVKPLMSKNGVSGQIGLYYQKRGTLTTNEQTDDYKIFIPTKSNGLTRTGQLLFQQSLESYVYSVLGAQASTRWPIAGRGAQSIQTQDIYHKKVDDTIIQSDQTVAISNMRKAIKDTNVILNTAISPGMLLIPSNMIILTEAIPGYNNILTLARKGIRFGVNNAVNYLKDETEDDTETTTPTTGSRTTTDSTSRKMPIYTDTTSDNPADAYKEYLYLLITTVVGGVLISRYVI